MGGRFLQKPRSGRNYGSKGFSTIKGPQKSSVSLPRSNCIGFVRLTSPTENMKPIFDSGGFAEFADSWPNTKHCIERDFPSFWHPTLQRPYTDMEEFSKFRMEREAERPEGCARTSAKRINTRNTLLLRFDGCCVIARVSDLMPNFGCSYRGKDSSYKKNSLWYNGRMMKAQ